jgi:ATP-dependent Clp protease ATP-binding subunit ClpC
MLKNKFTKNAIAAVSVANKTCIKLKSNMLTLEHLFIGILSMKEGIGSKVLAKLGLDPEGTIKSIEDELLGGQPSLQDFEDKETPSPSDNIAEVTISEEIRFVFEKAFEIAINAGHNYVGTEHLLLGMLEVKEHPFIKELNNLGISYDKINKELEGFVQYPEFQSPEKLGNQPPAPKMPGPQPPMDFPKPQSGNFFESIGRNLTVEARAGKLDPVIGRDKEIDRLMQVLSRRTKNNPILLGDAGVGKTAIVEGLAQRISEGTVSPVLSNYEIWSIDTAAIVAGSQLRGDIEQKVLDMINEIETRGNIILFIDEIHTILGAGATSNSSLDIGNILKPALARGVLHCIGATTVDEYKKYFDEDPALQRRFQPIDVEELSHEDTLLVMKKIRPIYEAFHNVKITDGALKASISLSARYITDRFLPDKSIDVIDEACAKNKLERVQVTPEFKEELDNLKVVIAKKNEALTAKKIEEASEYLDEEKKVMKKLAKMEKAMKKDWDSSAKKITEKEIKDVIHGWTKIPMNSIDEGTMEQVLKLEKDLLSSVIGQDYACQLVTNSIKRAKAGIAGFEKPLASFLFVGPTGVGKTELAKQLAKSLFGSKDALIQVDMSELMEAHSVSKLIGAPPGYVGFDNGGQLTDKVRRRPFSVILFDEIEKASPEVLNILLQIMDEGRLTDNKGRAINFKNTIIIMTSNIGAQLLRKDSSVGIYLGKVEAEDGTIIDHKVTEVEEKIIDELKNHLQPEFMNRIDDIVVFRELSKTDVTKISALHLNEFAARLKKESNIILNNIAKPEMVNYISDQGYSDEYGAREVKRVIRTALENVVAEKILELNWRPESKQALVLNVDLKEKKIVLKRVEKDLPKTKEEESEKEVAKIKS